MLLDEMNQSIHHISNTVIISSNLLQYIVLLFCQKLILIKFKISKTKMSLVVNFAKFPDFFFFVFIKFPDFSTQGIYFSLFPCVQESVASLIFQWKSSRYICTLVSWLY